MELSTVHTTLLQDNDLCDLTEDNFRELHNFRPREGKGVKKLLLQKTSCSRTTILNLIPILKWLPRYNFKENILFDIIAGLTVSVLQIPHGLAFAPLAYQEPVVGLYMAIFPVFAYAIFGTSRHLSLGMMGILIMMVGGVVTSHADMGRLENANETASDYSPLNVAVTITFTIGLWQLALGMLHLGSLCVLLSNSLVSGLTAAASIHILVIQLKNIFGLSITMATGPLKLFYITFDVLKHVGDSNYVSALTALSFFAVLILFNEFGKPFVAKRSRIPVPMEFIMIALSMGLSELLQLEKNYNVKTVGSVPGALPDIVLPSFTLIPKIAVDSLVIAVVSISFNISLGKVFAKKGGYEIDDNQELVAYGVSNVVGGFFQCLPVSASLSRSMVQFAVGGKTELAHFISLLSVLVMLLFLGPFFAKVPLCVLAAVVMATLKGLLIQIKDFPAIWRSSKLDGSVWLITFVTVVLVDIDYGIGFGLCASILTLLISASFTRVFVINELPNSNRLIPTNRYRIATSNKRFITLKIVGNVNFFNCSEVFSNIFEQAHNFFDNTDLETFVLIDLSTVPAIDPSAVAQLTSLVNVFKESNTKVLLASCTLVVYDTLHRCLFFDKFPKSSVIINVPVAVEYLKNKTL